MKKITLIVAFIILSLSLYSQTNLQKAKQYIEAKGEITFTFTINNLSDLDIISKQLSIVNYNKQTKTVKAWANEKQFNEFLRRNIPFQTDAIDNEASSDILMFNSNAYANRAGNTLTFPVAAYPTYADYAQQMQDFVNDNPTICQLVDIGATGEGAGGGNKRLLFIKLSDNVTTQEQEPKLMYSSSMHGDEIAGFPMMLDLINYFITAYNDTNHADYTRVQNLLNNSEVWINPLANPDGAYFNSPSNTSVVNARRANANGIDLNRNYPDNIGGLNPDGNAYQTETLAFMNLADNNHFVIAANFHGGAELVNYPWDNTLDRHPDDAWWIFTSREYADNAQANSPAGYMTDQNNGITHGGDWFIVEGGRQDYMNFYKQTKEFTVELSSIKLLPENQLVNHWNYNREALIDFLVQGTYGFRGVVKDAVSSNPIEATVKIVGQDALGSWTFSELPFGNYYRPIKAGTYDIIFEADCYQSVTLTNQTITDYQTLTLADVLLTPIAATPPTGLAASNVGATTATISWNTVTGATYDYQYRIFGSPTWTTVATPNVSENLSGLNALTQYEARVRSTCNSITSAYSSIITFTTTAIPPCTGTLINTYPYTETFDSGIGDWTQGTGDDGSWTLDAGGTPSNNTGPSDDITGGGNYFYTEASTGDDPGPNATVYLISPCFDLTSASNPFFSFSHHMFGASIGTLSLEISDNDGANWASLFLLSGDQGNQWNSVSIDVSSYVGQTVKFRFTGITGNGFASDIGIDQVRIGTPILVYCASNGNSTADEYINRVQLNTIDNNNSGVGTTSTGYSDFTAMSTDLIVGNSYNITITPTWTGTVYNEAYSVWIDFNKDGDFNDVNEEVFTQAPTQTSPVIGNFTIPVDASFGNTRMRVALKYNASLTSSCESFGFGEVEDYTINLVYDGLLYTNNVWTPNAPSGTTGTDNALLLDGTYDIASNINLNNLTINPSATVEVDKAFSINIGGNLVNNGTLALNSDSNEYSSLIVSGTVTGNVLYRRHVNTTGVTAGNDLISPPVSGQIFTDFIAANSNIVSNGTNTLYLFGPFDKTTGTYSLYSNAETATLNAGIGYRAASTNASTFTFSGTVNTGNINVGIVNSGPIAPEWNLVGNPYPSYIKLADFLSANNSQFNLPNAGVYGYDGNASDGWTIWNQAYSDANLGTIITPGQGFFVASKAGGGTIAFTPSMRSIGGGDDFIAGRSTPISHLKLQMNSGSQLYKTDFYFTDNASLGLDPGYDAGIYGGTAPSFAIYSDLVQDSDGLDMAIQSLGNLDLVDATIALGVNASQGQQITISITETTLASNIDVYLEDNVSNTFTLLNTSDYTFTPSTDLNGTGRFFLRFEPETLSITENSISGLQIYNTNNPKLLFINGILNENTTLNLYDIQGRLVLSKTLDSNLTSNKVNLNTIASGIYIVKLKNNTQSISQKIVIH